MQLKICSYPSTRFAPSGRTGLLLILVSCASLHATINVPIKGSTGPFGFLITNKVFDRPTGTFYVSVGATGVNSGPLAVSKAARPNPITSFTGIAQNAIINNTAIDYLTLATFTGNTHANVATVIQAVGGPQLQTNVTIMKNDGSNVQQSATLLDASGAANINGQQTAGIVGLAANQSFIFAAVKPNGGNFGSDPFGGIANVNINPTTLALTQLPAQSGDNGIKALQLAPATNQVRINNDPTLVANVVSLYWDDPLQRLYIGIQLTTNILVGSGAKSVIVAQINPTGTITFSNIAPNAAFNANQNIVGIQDPNESLAINKLRVLHASTGPSYLIVNGGNGTQGQTGNLIFALPLVDLSDPANPVQGTLAAKNSALTNGKFTMAAAINADLLLNTDAAAQVGGGPLALQSPNVISDMVVVGDTVYVSSNVQQTALNETGIFYSQALFDETGKIIRWTPWTKKIFPAAGFPGNVVPNTISLFDVDAVTASIWAVDGETKKSVAFTSWDKPTDNGSLPGKINTSLTNSTNITAAATAVLDLDQSTRGFVGNTPQRYALFGTHGKVLFARVSQALGPNINSPQTVTADFTQTTNFISTNLPTSACQCNVLEYARQLSGAATNYFFAGTQSGLFAFALPGGAGFNVTSLGLLNAPPLSTGSWQAVPTISGSITDIKTTGNTLYVMTYNTSATTPLQSSVYRIDFAPTLAAMFATPILVAQTEVTPFTNVKVFYGMQIISTQDDGSTEQLVIATNNGLFQSQRIGGVQAAANQADAAWISITNGFYNGIAGMDNASIPVASPSTVWPFTIQDQSGLLTFTRGNIQQLNGTTDATPFAFVPTNFNSSSGSSSFATLPQITYFWSDGARRIMITPNIQSFAAPDQLFSLPYNAFEWNISNPDAQILQSSVLAGFEAFYWIKEIGVTGIILAGTDHGVVALQ